MVETRLRLAVVELEEEKFNLIQMLMIAGITLLFAAFSLMSLLVLVILAIDQLYLQADAGYSGLVTVPVLWEKQQQTIVSNESADILRMFNSAMGLGKV
ncbi:hypothetical protein D8L93_03700 [Sodalis-like symbiont of Bactericera trigonica]|nr:hypothetical protein D8L93_03700 [Sodalis-like symbiont of Bactericera trigonica]